MSEVKHNHLDIDQEIRRFLRSKKRREDWERLFINCFLRKYIALSTPERSLASYPGYSSFYGKHQDDIEGFYRILPVMACWLSSGRPNIISIEGVGKIDITDIVFNGIRNATDPSSRGYYGSIKDYDGRIIAASIFALSLWYLKKSLWKEFSKKERKRIHSWLLEVNGKRVADNNWRLYVVLTNAVLKNLGLVYSEEEYIRHYLRFKSFYRGNGWYSDGPENVIDYYNAWMIHPYLIWIDVIDPMLDREFIRERTKEFLENFIYFFAPRGFPIFGRSVCYRMALPAPILLAEAFGWSPLRPGLARKAMTALWEYFLMNGAVKGGLITQGYLEENLDFLDNYSGPASCNWSLLSLAALFSIPRNSPFWEEALAPLPVEQASYELKLDPINMAVIGERGNRVVRVLLDGGESNKKVEVCHYSAVKRMLDRMISMLKLRESTCYKKLPHRIKKALLRPDNTQVKYNLGIYSSHKPFCSKKFYRDVINLKL